MQKIVMFSLLLLILLSACIPKPTTTEVLQAVPTAVFETDETKQRNSSPIPEPNEGNKSIPLTYDSQKNPDPVVDVRFINFPEPEWKMVPLPKSLQTCAVNGTEPGGCVETESLKQLQCDQVIPLPLAAGGLKPDGGYALCVELPFLNGEDVLPLGTYLYQTGCMLPGFTSVLAEKDGVLVKLTNQIAMADYFGSIKSANQALGYAVLMTGLEPYFGLSYQEGWRYYSTEIRDTHVEQINDAFRVRLYQYDICGCGPHSTAAVDVWVRPDGTIQVSEPTLVFENPEEDLLCVD